jgi:flavin reductase (DIM6/NTAB) family NADH-FMN oxidoreductase RutF
MPLSIDPPFVGVAIHPSRHTHDMIRFSEEFALNIPSRRLLNHTQYFGVISGREIQKIEAAKIPTFRARKVDAPLLEGCVGYIECGLEDALRLGDHTLFVGRVVAVSAEKDAFDDTWLLEDDDDKPLHYLGLDYYAIMGNRLQAKLRTTEAGGIHIEEEAEEEMRRRPERA